MFQFINRQRSQQTNSRQQNEPASTDQSPTWASVSPRVFEERKGTIFIGGEEIPQQLRDVLRDQAQSLLTTQLYEVLEATLTDEAYRLALKDSTTWEHVLSAKMLHHYVHAIRNIVHTLAK